MPHLVQFWQMVGERVTPRHRAGRLKQWLNLLRRRYPEAQQAFDQLRTLNDCRAVTDWVNRLQAQPQDQAALQSSAPAR